MKPLSQAAIRGLMIAAQGLDNNQQLPASKDSIVPIIRKIHMLHIDGINVIARAPYMTLWSRLGSYDPHWLDELLEEGALFEYWANANCFLPIEDYPLYHAGSWIIEEKNPRKWLDEHPAVTEKVLEYIRVHGGARVSDFERTDVPKGAGLPIKDEQTVLEYLYYLGEVMVRKHEKLQRVYDLRERVYPDADRLRKVTFDDAQEQFVLNTVQALGVTKAEWIASYFRLKKAWVSAALKRLAKTDNLIEVSVEGWHVPGYVHPDDLEQVDAASRGDIPESRTTLLSPFDPLVWDRDRTFNLFGFDFPIEFYLPAAKRKYGYYCLPILHNNALIGRLDPKAHRKEGIFEVKQLHFEPGVRVTDGLVDELRRILHDCAAWHNTPRVIVHHASEPGLAERLSSEPPGTAATT